MPDLLFLLLLALVLLGPKKLPQIAGQIGRYLAQFQRMKREVLDQLNAEMVKLDEEKQSQGNRQGGDESGNESQAERGVAIVALPVPHGSVVPVDAAGIVD
jgi:Sec-independent protein translocase protein TatA